MLAYFIGTMSGFIGGVFFVMFISYLFVRAERLNKQKLIAEQKIKQEEINKKYEIARPRLKKAAEISNKQLELFAATQGPSQGALHSKWKNDVLHEIKELEKEKRDILRSIIKEGLDPELTLTEEANGKKETVVVKLSEYMKRNNIPLVDGSEIAQTTPEVVKNKKFFIIDGGKSDVTH